MKLNNSLSIKSLRGLKRELCLTPEEDSWTSTMGNKERVAQEIQNKGRYKLLPGKRTQGNQTGDIKFTNKGSFNHPDKKIRSLLRERKNQTDPHLPHEKTQ